MDARPAGPQRQGGGVRLLLGRALASHKAEHQLLPKVLALPVFASDQLSSVAYATEEMLLVLVLVGTSGLSLLMPLSVGVAALLVVVIVSYRQTVREYPQGGGSYIVAKENLGLLPGLTAAGAIQISYVLTVAVTLEKLGTKSVTYRFDFTNQRGESVAVGRMTSVFCRSTGPDHIESLDIPADIRAKLESAP